MRNATIEWMISRDQLNTYIEALKTMHATLPQPTPFNGYVRCFDDLRSRKDGTGSVVLKYVNPLLYEVPNTDPICPWPHSRGGIILEYSMINRQNFDEVFCKYTGSFWSFGGGEEVGPFCGIQKRVDGDLVSLIKSQEFKGVTGGTPAERAKFIEAYRRFYSV